MAAHIGSCTNDPIEPPTTDTTTRKCWLSVHKKEELPSSLPRTLNFKHPKLQNLKKNLKPSTPPPPRQLLPLSHPTAQNFKPSTLSPPSPPKKKTSPPHRLFQSPACVGILSMCQWRRSGPLIVFASTLCVTFSNSHEVEIVFFCLASQHPSFARRVKQRPRFKM